MIWIARLTIGWIETAERTAAVSVAQLALLARPGRIK